MSSPVHTVPIAPDEIAAYCRDIESYLCRKNEGHLVRVVGPSFDLVSRWATEGVPFKVACLGIDRYVERYYRKGPRRRPVHIDFCEADVLEAFDEWRRALGLTAVASGAPEASTERKGVSLPEHLERALVRLTSARATGHLGEAGDPLIDEVSSSLDRARNAPGGLRGEDRKALIDRLASMDAALAALAREVLGAEALDGLRREAGDELAGFRDQMAPERFAHALDIAVDRLLRARLGLPTLTFS